MEQLNTDHYRPHSNWQTQSVNKMTFLSQTCSAVLSGLCHQPATTSFSAFLKGLSIPLVVITWKVSDHKKEEKYWNLVPSFPLKWIEMENFVWKVER